MINKKFIGIIASIFGIIMFVISFALFSIYSAIPIRVITKLAYNLFSVPFKLSFFPTIVAPIAGIIMLILSLFFTLLGISLVPVITLPISYILIITFSIFSILHGLDFFHSPFRSQIYVDYFANISFILFLILISGLIYVASILFLFKLKSWSRKLIIGCSTILILYFIPLSIYLFFDPWGWGGVAAVSLLPYTIFPLFFIILFTRPKVKEHFKR